MPRVIRKEAPIEKEAKCECGAVVGYHRDEVQSRHGLDISGGPDGEEWIVCPDCSRRITLRVW